MEHVYKDNIRLRITEFETRWIDQWGDCFEVLHFETKQEATDTAKAFKAIPNASGAVVEKHDKFYPSHLFATPDKYKTIAFYGDVGTWADDDA